MTIEQLQTHIPYLEKELLQQIEQHGVFKTLPPQTYLLREGSHVNMLPLVLSGRVKVLSTTEERDLLLYYIEEGQSCIMSFAAAIENHQSRVEALTETETELLLLPVNQLQQWLNRYPSIHRFMYKLYNQRYLELVERVNHLIFWKMEDRLLKYLHEQARLLQSRELPLTHQQIAQDLGSVREVISRVLKKLEAEGKISQRRHLICLLEEN
ncbi:MAG: Crp/Fnr family transcriptional regulator [Bacteroidetes bacterium]|nr:MAG: Crp/Fnr family transcriptional regulator [Bacteroidota bacterium]